MKNPSALILIGMNFLFGCGNEYAVDECVTLSALEYEYGLLMRGFATDAELAADLTIQSYTIEIAELDSDERKAALESGHLPRPHTEPLKDEFLAAARSGRTELRKWRRNGTEPTQSYFQSLGQDNPLYKSGLFVGYELEDGKRKRLFSFNRYHKKEVDEYLHIELRFDPAGSRIMAGCDSAPNS